MAQRTGHEDEDYYDNDANVGYEEAPTDLNIKNAAIGTLSVDSHDTVIRQDKDFKFEILPSQHQHPSEDIQPEDLPAGVSQIKDSVSVNTVLRSERTDIDISGTTVRAKMPRSSNKPPNDRHRSDNAANMEVPQNQMGIQQFGGFSLANISGSSGVSINMDGFTGNFSNASSGAQGRGPDYNNPGGLILSNTIAINTIVDSEDTKITMRDSNINIT